MFSSGSTGGGLSRSTEPYLGTTQMILLGTCGPLGCGCLERDIKLLLEGTVYRGSSEDDDILSYFLFSLY